nr:hypothetical protein [Tanacetum cinerariifolium]
QRDAEKVVDKQVDSKNKLKAVNGGVEEKKSGVEEKNSPLSEDSNSFDSRVPAKELETDSDDPGSYGSIRSYDEDKENQEKNKIGSKLDKNGKRGEAGKSLKQL